METKKINFLHLSDIHFNKTISAGKYDLDAHLRRALENDATSMLSEIGDLSKIVISGDIAYSGHKKEYEIANKWLGTLSKKLGCSKKDIWVTPGNHDVQRKVIEASQTLQNTHLAIRNCGIEEVDTQIFKYSNDKLSPDILYKSIENYNNEFAINFSCEISAINPFWEKTIKVNSKLNLVFRGINSAIISDNLDMEKNLVVGSAQSLISPGADSEHIIICHHPPSWLRDEDNFIDSWNNHACLQLFGHKHRQRVLPIKNSVVVSSGAAHPNRREPNWNPTYNFIQFLVDENEHARKVTIRIFTRVWNDGEQKFFADFADDGAPYREHVINRSFNDKRKKKRIKIMIADDAQIVLEGLKSVISANSNLKLIHEFKNNSSTVILSEISKNEPDVFIIDLKWFGDEEAGNSIIKKIKTSYPNIKIIAISAYENLLELARSSGADEALPKTYDKEELINIINILAYS